jgi:hypothetical protein
MFEPKLETYMIFLHKRFFKKSIFRLYYKKIVKNLENKGICVIPIKDIIEYQKENTDNILKFDDKIYPDTSVLYIHMCNGKYYNDNIYSRKKMEAEREILLLVLILSLTNPG